MSILFMRNTTGEYSAGTTTLFGIGLEGFVNTATRLVLPGSITSLQNSWRGMVSKERKAFYDIDNLSSTALIWANRSSGCACSLEPPLK